jgi:hypothetical protein
MRLKMLKMLIGILKKFIMVVLYFSGSICDFKVDIKGWKIPDRPCFLDEYLHQNI